MPPRAIDDHDSAMAASLLDDLATGRLPYLRVAVLDNTPPIEELVPAGAAVVRRIDRDRSHDWVFEGPGYRGRIEESPIGCAAAVQVFATEVDLAHRVVDEMKARCPEPPADDAVHVSVWHGAGDRRRRKVAAPAWDDVARNYATHVRTALDALVRFEPTEPGGRILLLHGEPGTGKTTAIRMLLGAWRHWVEADIVTDGDDLLNDAGFLTEVTQARDDRWHVVIIEDAGSLVDDDAVFGGGLSRLLNATDGIVGAGSRTLFLLTTNEAIGRPHRALTRPGRCVANVEFTRFTRREALDWLGEDAVVPHEGLTLADLYERRSAATIISNLRPAVVRGLYL